MKKSDVWPQIGDQAERNAMLQVLLEELEVYEIMLERLYVECGGMPTKYDDLKSERDLKTQMSARERMIHVLAMKNTDFVV